jgi:AcrR family transcriptional regulator
MFTDQDSIRKRLIEARRVQILDAATALFAEKGYYQATTKVIAQAAGVSERTIYNYFASKADLLIGIMDRLAEPEVLDKELGDAQQSGGSFFLIAVFHHYQQRCQALQAILPEMLVSPELRDRYYQQVIAPHLTILEKRLSSLIQQGQAHSLDVPLTARAILGMVLGMVVLQMLGDDLLQSRRDDLPRVLLTLPCTG